MQKPTTFPDWAENDTTLPIAGTANKIIPDSEFRNNGYDETDYPAAQHWNYQLNLINEWVKALDEVTDTATETQEGVVELATDAEAQAYTADKIIDGAKLATALQGSNQALTTSGYQRFPGGLIVQWGRIPLPVSVSTAPVDTTFPLAFPTACFSVTASIGVNNTDYDAITNYRSNRQQVSVGVPTPTGFEGQALIDNNTLDSRIVQWVAYGF